jgi:predicted O-methyltransferase YrrM
MRMLQESSRAPFSLNPQLLSDVLYHAKPLGHHEAPENLNLGFGFIYYGLVRALRPKHVLVIGSGFGFSVVCLALGLKDNDSGRLTFVDPSYSVFKNGPLQTVGGRGQWDDPRKVHSHFARFGVEGRIVHHRLRSDQFFPRYEPLGLPPIDLAFIDGNHSYAAVKHDFLNVVERTRKNSYVLLHDTNIYIREMVRHAGVKRWIKSLRRNKECFEVLDFPFSSGVAMVRVLRDKLWIQAR